MKINANKGQAMSAPAGKLASLALPTLLSSLAASVTNVSLPTLVQAFDASFQDVQWVVLSYLLAITTLIIGVGRLGDIVSRRNLLLAGIGLFIIASLGCALAPTIGFLITARALQGLGAAVMMTITLALVGETINQERMGRAMGLLGTLSAVGTSLGPTVGGVLIAGVGWQAIFLINLPLGAIALGLVWYFLPVSAPQPGVKPRGFDHGGMALLGLTLVLFALAMTLGKGHFSMLNIALLLGATAGARLFVWVENKACSPLIDMALLRQPALSISLITNMLVTLVMMTTLVVGPFYLSHGLGLAPQQVGLSLSIGPLIAALSGVPAGYLVDRFGTRKMVIVGLAGVSVGACVLSVISPPLGILGYVLPVCLLTAGYALFQAANNTAVIKEVTSNQRGVVSGLLNLSRNLGFICGASAIGALFALMSASGDTTRGMQFSYLVAGLLTVAGLAMTLANHFWQERQAIKSS
ncbi:EmrB/QacA subfamily drug resistance transporter [Serratia fonticola]|jgi:EmrB/QacA subfamily drug resistance transporter|uniref:EmrB/QacA subfamily drug resistance transporter n=1 Tax=Serratia fonticola TaxID=47917 RepID=A0A559TBK9_SERFO|nr:MFS transporter [Serratia fonticola]TQI80523.1 EmrB/QacA subfamily drug resistance transporter [Serratia fonticola]TQI97452.1 EmrB/QacA subfamily drug resistance transporter [Serratia fonticola]TVZ71949.1 EmrB/QacA subfamily drug resistance transporter [Serratia fonticola]